MALRMRSLLANSLALYAQSLGRLAVAWAIRQVDDRWKKSLGETKELAIGLMNSSHVAFLKGRLIKACALANTAMTGADPSKRVQTYALAHRARAAHALGDVVTARADFALAKGIEGERLIGIRGAMHANHYLDLGDHPATRAICDHGIASALAGYWNQDLPRFYALLARTELAESGDPTPNLDQVRVWTSRTGEMQFIIEAHLLTARYLVASGDPQAAFGEAEAGLLHAIACGYGILRIELLVAMARIRLAWPDAPKAIQAAREALDLAVHPDCLYAWGEADAAQAWGEAYFANHESMLAKRAFDRALEARKRIEHPGIAETEKWIERVS